MSVATLSLRRDKINAQLKELSHARQAHAKLIRQSRYKSSSVWKIPDDVFSTAFVIFEKCGWSLEPSVAFLQAFAKRKRWPYVDNGDIETLLEKTFLARDPNELLSLAEAHDANAHDALVCNANQYIREWQIVSWGRELNVSYGVAPTTAELLRKAIEVDPMCSLAAFCRTPTGRPSGQARAWASKFRKKWSARFARIRLECGMSASEKRAKVSTHICFHTPVLCVAFASRILSLTMASPVESSMHGSCFQARLACAISGILFCSNNRVKRHQLCHLRAFERIRLE